MDIDLDNEARETGPSAAAPPAVPAAGLRSSSSGSGPTGPIPLPKFLKAQGEETPGAAPAPTTPVPRHQATWGPSQEKGPMPAVPRDPLYENCPWSQVRAAEKEVMESSRGRTQQVRRGRGQHPTSEVAKAAQRPHQEGGRGGQMLGHGACMSLRPSPPRADGPTLHRRRRPAEQEEGERERPPSTPPRPQPLAAPTPRPSRTRSESRSVIVAKQPQRPRSSSRTTAPA